MKRFITDKVYKVPNSLKLCTLSFLSIGDRTFCNYGFSINPLKISICSVMDKIYDLYETDLDLRMGYYL